MARLALLVEDEATILMLIDGVLEGAGYDRLTASTFAEATTLLEHPIDVLVTDLELAGDPDAGFRIAELARERYPDVPVVYASARALNDGMQELMVASSVFVTKPYRPEELIAAVDGFFSQNS